VARLASSLEGASGSDASSSSSSSRSRVDTKGTGSDDEVELKGDETGLQDEETFNTKDGGKDGDGSDRRRSRSSS